MSNGLLYHIVKKNEFEVVLGRALSIFNYI